MPTESTVNGRACSFANMKIKITPKGRPTFFTRAFSAIKFADKADGELVLGTGSVPIAKTDGVVKPEGSLTMYRDDWKAFQDALRSVSRSIATVDFDVHVSWAPKDESGGSQVSKTRDAVLYNCSLNSRSLDAAIGGGAQEVEGELLYTKLEIDGVVLYEE